MALIVNIKPGDAPLASAALERARFAEMERRGWPEWRRSEALLWGQVDPTHPTFVAATAALAQFRADVIETLAVNTFNAQLLAYREATSRLARHRLADQQDGITTRTEIDPETLVETEIETTHATEAAFVAAIDAGEVIKQRFIAALPAQIEAPVLDEATGEQTGTQMIDNPAIERDDAERANAQAVVDATPVEVVDWIATHQHANE